MAKGKERDDSEKSSIIMALIAGRGVSEVAREFGWPRTSVSNLKAAIARESQLSQNSVSQVSQVSQVSHPQTTKSEMVEAVNTYLLASLSALATQARLASDETYLRRFSPQQLAILHGTMADKTARIIEAVNGIAGRESPVEESGAGEAGSSTKAGVTIIYADDTTTTAARGPAEDQD